MSVFETGKMQYRRYGNSGLKISVVSLGNMINSKPENYEEDKAIIAHAFKNGVNYIDTAEIYDEGKAEIQLGKILKDLKVDREDIVIATKIRTGVNPGLNSTLSTNRKHIRESIDQSLARLQLDYVDILFAHFHDDNTPIEEICRGFHEVIEEGKVFYWATSNWDAEHVYNALAVCEKYNLHKPIGTQSQYNMLTRKQHEVEYKSLYQNYNYGLVAWSPLAGGFLTGKYLDGIKAEMKTRLTEEGKYPLEMVKAMFYNPFANEKNIKNLTAIQKIAEEELKCKLVHVAIAWAIHYQHLDSALIGARNVQQLQDCLEALDVLEKFTPELLARINKILDNTPEPPIDFKNWRPYPPIRPVAKE